MKKFDELNESIRKMEPDIRLEVILADLLAAGLSMDDVEIVSNSLFHRNYHRDIEETGTTESGPADRKKLRIVVNRQGVYDQLPEDLFHQPALAPGSTEKKAVLQELRDQAKTEAQSRRFFLPIEHEFFLQRVRLENEEKKFLFEKSDNVPAEIFDLLWDLPEFLDEKQKSRLGLLMPLLHSISGNMSMMGVAMESVTGDPVAIRPTVPRDLELPDTDSLGVAILGKSFLLGGTISSFQSGYRVTVSLSDEQSITDWLSGGKKRSLYEFLCTLLMPFDADVIIEPALPAPGSGFLLDDERSSCARLNFTTNI